jgi:hypothetical protein
MASIKDQSSHYSKKADVTYYAIETTGNKLIKYIPFESSHLIQLQVEYPALYEVFIQCNDTYIEAHRFPINGHWIE